MDNRILVTYASRSGSTAQAAEAIGRVLAKGTAAAGKVQVDVMPMETVTDLSPYRAVVAGSAIQGGQWLPEALQFMQAHQAELSSKPFAAFLLCMTLAMKKGDYRDQVNTWLNPVRSMVRPVSTGLFAGALHLSKIPSLGDRLKFWLSIRFGVWSEGDHRDWNAIHQWASDLRPLLVRQASR